jgi:hypothetical protein
MENLMDWQVIMTVVGGAVLSILTGVLKKYSKLDKLNPQHIVLGLAVVAGILYQGYVSYIPEALQQQILNYIYGVLSSAVLIYEFLYKNLKKSK